MANCRLCRRNGKRLQTPTFIPVNMAPVEFRGKNVPEACIEPSALNAASEGKK
jgi:hypothetical protein